MGTGERHTFLFTDLVGFTALTEANGDDGAAELALDFYDRVRRLLPDHATHAAAGRLKWIELDEPALKLSVGSRLAGTA